jgi:hypothetical protein
VTVRNLYRAPPEDSERVQLNDHFRVFHSNLTPDESRMVRARSAHEALHAALVGATRSLFVESFLQGSYVHQTLIRPRGDAEELDIDVVVVIGFTDEATPLDAVNWFRAMLGRIPAYAPVIEPRARCVRIHSSGGFHLDVVPARAAHGVLEVPARSCKHWNATNPKGLADWHRRENDRTSGRFARVAKMLKHWRNETVPKELAPPSTAFEVLMAGETPVAGSDSEAVVRALRGLAERVAGGRLTVPNPSLPTEDLARDWTPPATAGFSAYAAHAAATAAAALQEETVTRSVELWRELFPERFPVSA